MIIFKIITYIGGGILTALITWGVGKQLRAVIREYVRRRRLADTLYHKLLSNTLE